MGASYDYTNIRNCIYLWLIVGGREMTKCIKDRRLTRNAAKCLKCNTTVESKHRHDFVMCACGDLFVDGGLEYNRAGFKNLSDVEDLCEYEEYMRKPYTFERENK